MLIIFRSIALHLQPRDWGLHLTPLPQVHVAFAKALSLFEPHILSLFISVRIKEANAYESIL